MRISGGDYKGRTLLIPKTYKTRPLSDLGREALFNILGDVSNFYILDCFAGSGAVGIEALSRGAQKVDGVEIGREARKIIGRNLLALKLEDRYNLISISAEKWIQKSEGKKIYNVIYIGAPFGYDIGSFIDKVSSLLRDKGVLVVEMHKKSELLKKVSNVEFKFSRKYGESVLLFYQA
jgi:16S rRNA (guanine966-N2)-methyltransferase